LARHALLHDRDERGWRDWLARLGQAPNAPLKGARFSQASLAIDAAVAGQGIALARTALAALDLAAGRLLRPLAAALPADFAYWILSRREHAATPAVARFRDWLLRRARRTRV
jgi:LysR family glycine cleavage system transcriptional activator